TNREFSEHAFPVRFMEESQEIFSLADFWLETLFHLARECAERHPELARDLRETHAALSSRWREQGLADHARASVLEAADRLGRKLVLIVENLQSLCDNTDEDFGWQLRAVLQSEPQIMLLASATSRFEGLDNAEEPYFELFRTVDLKPLDTEECRLLWQVVSGAPRSKFEIRPLEILTGGSPRLLAIIAGFARHRSLRQLMEELVTLIDEHTEYFRGHLEALPRSERRVYVALMDLWRPSSTGDIAARARIDIRTASTMLGRLVERGAVTADSARGSRKRLYAAAEPLYSIYYKLRREGDEAAVVENLIRFMVVFYDTSELFAIQDLLRNEAIASKTIQAGIDRALARKPEPGDLHSEMKWNRIEQVSRSVQSNRRLEAEIRLNEDVRKAMRKEEWGKIIEAVDRFIASGVSSSATGMEDHDRVFTAVLESEAYFRMGQFGRVVTIGASIVDRFRDTRDVFILYWSARVLFLTVKAYFELGNFGATVSNAREMDRWFERYTDDQFNPVVAEALVVQAKAEAELGNVDTAVSLLDSVVQRFGASEHPEVRDVVVGALVTKADSLRLYGNDGEGALAVYDETVERYGTSEAPEIRSRIINALHGRALTQAGLGDFEGEIASYQEVIDRMDDNETPDAEWGALLALGFKAMRQAETGRTGEALAACSELERTLEKWTGDERAWFEWQTWYVRAMASLLGKERVASVDAFRLADEALQPNNEIAMRGMIRFVLNSIALGAPEIDVLEILSEPHNKSQTLAPLIVALRQRTGETVQAPAEVLGVAEDIRKRIEEKAARGILTAF
ncbi:MAG: hypothetical protein OXC05_16960, partial [Halieaceae bacterium]|nr:hypothetical protein [Halieaceae bacterium]